MALTTFLLAYLNGLYSATWRSYNDVNRRQNRLWRKMPMRDYPALRGLAGQPFDRFPVVDVADYRAAFSDYNRLGISLEDASRAALAAEQGKPAMLPKGVSAGLSTGTSGGPRGVFLTSPDERAAYIGTVLSKLLPPAEWSRTRRITLCLRAGNALYEALDVAGLELRFLPLTVAQDALLQDLRVAPPDILIAPPQLLLSLACDPQGFTCRRLYYGAEPLNATERAFIAERLGVRPDPIYQATEGFLGAPCRLGTLHLNEDNLIVERDWLGDAGHFRPIVTDLRRRTQAVVRLRLDDVLQQTTCACGSPLTAVHPVCGRIGDVWPLGRRVVFPDEVEALVAPLVAPDRRWIATAARADITVACPDDADADRIVKGLAVYGRPVTRVPYDPADDFPKRRHVRAAA